MKPYGMKRNHNACPECPDRADIANGGLPSRWGRLKARSKASTRRLQKRNARRDGRVEIVAQASA